MPVLLLPDLHSRQGDLRPHQRLQQALCRRLRETVERFPFTIRREKVKMTISIGVASLPEDTLDLETLLQKADQALYRAKHEGRNRVCLSES